MLLTEAPATEDREALYAHDLAEDGYVWNLSRLWGWRTDVHVGFHKLRTRLTESSTLSQGELAVMVTATASALGDSYCCYAWGPKIDADASAAVIRGGEDGLTAREAALARWARAVVRDPNGTTAEDVQALRDAGLDDREIFEATTWIAFRQALATVNDALGVGPDSNLVAAAPEPVRAAVTFGRPAS